MQYTQLSVIIALRLKIEMKKTLHIILVIFFEPPQVLLALSVIPMFKLHIFIRKKKLMDRKKSKGATVFNMSLLGKSLLANAKRSQASTHAIAWARFSII